MEDNSEYLHAHSDLIERVNENMPDEEILYEIAELYKIFGDSTNRHVVFENGSPADLEGQPVVMEIKMRDADMYSFKFE